MGDDLRERIARAILRHWGFPDDVPIPTDSSAHRLADAVLAVLGEQTTPAAGPTDAEVVEFHMTHDAAPALEGATHPYVEDHHWPAPQAVPDKEQGR